MTDVNNVNTYIFSGNRGNFEEEVASKVNLKAQNRVRWTDVDLDAYHKMLQSRPKIGYYVIDDIIYPVNTQADVKINLSDAYILFLSNHLKVRNIDCLHNLQCKVIGITDLTAYTFVKTLQKAYRIFPENVRILFIKPEHHFILHTPNFNQQFDLICTTMVPESIYGRYLRNSRLGLFGFDDNVDWNRINMFFPFLQLDRNADLLRMFGNGMLYPSRFGTLIRVRSKLVSFSPHKEEFSNFTLVRAANDDDITGYKFRCYGDPYARSQYECEHAYDTFGKPRHKDTAWDAPCQQNTDCPFYRPNRQRGMCLPGGFCELPVGVKRLGFRSFSMNRPYQGFCYGCEPMDIECCQRMKPIEWVFPGEKLI